MAGTKLPKLGAPETVSESNVGTSPPTPPWALSVLEPVSRIDSVALSALDDTIMRAKERVRVLERITTSKGLGIAEEIEQLRDQRPAGLKRAGLEEEI